MKIQVLGSGSAFTLKNYQTSFLLDNTLLIDCGGDIRFALRDVGLSYKDIDHVFISHLHGDHIGGLEWLGFTKYFDSTQKTPNLYISEVLIDPLWDSLKASMGGIQEKIKSLQEYFEVYSIGLDGKLICDGIPFNVFPNKHIMNGFYFVPSFSIMGYDYMTGKKIFFSGDTQYDPDYMNILYNASDIIFHDCEYLYLPDGKPIMSKVHSHYEELKKLDDHIKEIMYLVHFQDSMLDIDVTKDGFKGKVIKGDVITI